KGTITQIADMKGWETLVKYYRKRKLIKFLKTKGIDYNSVPIPDYIIDMAKEQYPSTWKEYLKKY
ncbi:hypothetical protein, partial [Leyella lascolaii]|uniref:hypothetical protein n=1 Tax=Leyella lascolaii TaxID=1776379 RepID=UPI0029422D8E